ncbi:MAG: ABC transporter substrate-binding protein [Candidatus Gottesmanbacteria bacterium]|nr:ABC transporter substrate-binding protein [Candidatus Gottesmanbacteria bacterium]
MIFRQSRYLILVTRELSKKYTLPLILGFLLGLFGMIAFRQFALRAANQLTTPSVHIGLVGDVTLASLPLSIQTLISSGLSAVKMDGSPRPDLATKWIATDSGRTYVFTIAENAHWHDGKPVMAKDINYNIRDVTFAVDSPYAIRATLKEPFSPFLTLVSKPILQTGLKGFGMYRVGSVRLKGDAIQTLRLDPVAGQTISAREYRFYRTESAAITAFELGDVDILEDLSSSVTFTNWKNASVSARPRYNRVVALYFNTRESLLAEKSFRQALGYAIPELGFERAYSPIAKTSWGYTDTIKKYDYDLRQAKKLMTNSKVASQSARLTISTFSQYIDVAQKIATSWTNLGVATGVQIVNQVEPFQVFLSAQAIPPDPDQYPLWHSTQTPTNITGYVNVKIDKLLEDGRREQDIEKRKKIYFDFAKRLVEDAPALFLYYPTTYTVTRRK